MGKSEYVYSCKVGAVKTYYVLQKEDGSEFLAASKRGLPVIRTIEGKNVYDAQIKYWRQLKEAAKAGV